VRSLARLVPDDPEVARRAAELADRAPVPEAAPVDRPLPPELAVLDEIAVEPPGRERLVGVVDRFFEDKGFGFLHYERGQSIFFHVTQCEEGAAGITPGIRMSFRVGHNPKKGKPQAEALRRVEG
jgi:cold shock CspA family protein